ncbi:MAG: methyltransferase domain-containing protein [Gammaproteobacteria bacterium]|jgi:predicted methyltransferase|nr:methyltransferase domain-containing protein [Gammaproteobacteria bacterium]
MNKFKHLFIILAGSSLLVLSSFTLADGTSADLVANALIHGDRPSEDAADDGRRMPLEVLAFAGIEAGMTVLEMEAGGGYYTEILSRTVGASGSVIMQNPGAFDGFFGEAADNRVAGNRLPNVRLSKTNFDALDAPDNSVDMVTWILGPHELWFVPGENVTLGDPAASFQEIARVLKPGGVFLVVDHISETSAGPEVGGTLHRIGEGVVANLAERAGLSVMRSSNLHKNDDDPLNNSVFDPSIQGQTSKFVVLYRK